MPEIPSFVVDRARSQEPVFAADEVGAWPDGLLDDLITTGVISPTSNARSVACDSCGDAHVEVVQFVESPSDTKLRAYIPCPENGRVRIPLERLRRWNVNLKRALAEQSGSDRTDVRTVYLHHPAGRRVYVCIVNEQKQPFDFATNCFQPLDRLSNHRDACLFATGRSDDRADFAYSYSVSFDLYRLVARTAETAVSPDGLVFSIHWLVQKADEPMLREDTVLLDSCRVRFVNGRFTTADKSSDEMFDESVTFAKKEKWKRERQEVRGEEQNQHRTLSSRLYTATEHGQVGDVLRVFADSLSHWAGGLKRHLFDHFFLDAKDPFFSRMYQSPPPSGFEIHPHWVTAPWIGMQETYDLLEFHKSPDFANAFSVRVQKLLDARNAFSSRIVEVTAEFEHDIGLETFVALEKEQKELRYLALALCEHLNLLASQFDVSRGVKLVDTTPQLETPLPMESGETGNAAEKRTWPDPCEHTVAKVWTRMDGTVCLSTKTEGVRDGDVEFAPTIAGVSTNQMRFIQMLCFKFPNPATLVEVIEQVYPEEFSTARRDAQTLKKILRKIRSLVSDIRIKKLSKAGLNPDIVPSLSIDTTLDHGISLQLAHLHRLDDKDLDAADEAL